MLMEKTEFTRTLTSKSHI